MAYRMNIHYFSQHKKERTPRKLSESKLTGMKKYMDHKTGIGAAKSLSL